MAGEGDEAAELHYLIGEDAIGAEADEGRLKSTIGNDARAFFQLGGQGVIEGHAFYRSDLKILAAGKCQALSY